VTWRGQKGGDVINTRNIGGRGKVQKKGGKKSKGRRGKTKKDALSNKNEGQGKKRTFRDRGLRLRWGERSWFSRRKEW